VAGSVSLVGGDPGIGKSTLTLQVGRTLAESGQRVLYVSAEESVQQTRLRAERLGALSDELYVVSETNIEKIKEHADKLEPALIVVDSIQMVYKPSLASAPGSVAQVRESATDLVYLAKRSGAAMFIIGHVTKEGALAGPRTLEHLVDSVF
jgi:DNA repair protein RadA/Sms